MTTVNKVFLLGRLGSDPQLETLNNGNRVVNISLATDKFTKHPNDKPIKIADWHQIVFWNKQADLVAKYCHKGSMIHVEGQLSYREWETKQGEKRTSVEVIGWNIQLLDPKPKEEKPASNDQPPGDQYQNQAPPF